MSHVAVCVCTCNRPEGLRRALDGIAALDTTEAIRVVVVDNHADQAGAALCRRLAGGYRFPLTWRNEKRPGISFARNTAFAEALNEAPEYVAVFDDDEWPHTNWLKEMLAAANAKDADIVCGLVEPVFSTEPPVWMVAGAFFQKNGHHSTANLLLRAQILEARRGCWFEPALALSGGEDANFLDGLVDEGRRSIRCFNAIVYEMIPVERMSMLYILRRAIRDGNANILAHRLRKPGIGGAMCRALRPFAKAGHALSHLFWSPLQPFRIRCAAQDLARSAGMILALLGYAGNFYAGEHRHISLATDRSHLKGEGEASQRFTPKQR